MLSKLRSRRPSHATVVAYLALFLALGGTSAYAANTVFSTDIVDGEVKHADLAGNSVTSTNIFNGSVLNPEIGDGAVDSSKVADESLTSNDLATNSVGPTEAQPDSIDTDELFDGGVLGVDLAAGAVGNSQLASNAVSGSKVLNNGLTTADIKGADVNGGHISIPASSVANGRCKQFPVAVGGAKAGEAVVLSTQAALQEGVLIYGQRVSADDNVTMDVCNFSGTTQAAITDLPVRVITFG